MQDGIAMNHQDYMTGTRQRGAVKFYNTEKGYGFILPDDGTRDMFVHVSSLAVSGLTGLGVGECIEYSVRPDKRTGRPCAHDIRVLE